MTTTIPGVRDQVRRWATGRAAKDADTPQRETIDARDLKNLGTVGRSAFARTKDGRELKLKSAMPHALEQVPDDAVLVTKLVRMADGRPRTDVFIGRIVEAGTFEKLQRQKTYTPRQRPPSPVDRDHELRAEDVRQVVHLGKDGDDPMDVIRGAMSHVPGLLVTDGRASFRTVADEIAYLERSGVTLALSVDGAYLLATFSKAAPVARAMLTIRAPLYRAHLAGEPMRCAWEHPAGKAPEAVTFSLGNAPVCAEHLSGAA